jgi:hypothetical protein
VQTYRYRALVTLDASASGVRASYDAAGTYTVTVHACPPGSPGCDHYFPAALCPDDETPLMPGEQSVVTITLTDERAGSFLGPGQHFTVRAGGHVGQGIISRRILIHSHPC